MDGNRNWTYTAGTTLANDVYQVTAADATNGASTSISVTVDTLAPAVPTSFALTPASDSVWSQTDGVTNVAMPT